MLNYKPNFQTNPQDSKNTNELFLKVYHERRNKGEKL